MNLDAERGALYAELEGYFRGFRARDFLKLDDEKYGLQGIEDHFEELILWIKRFFSKRNKYREHAPVSLLNNTINSINDTRRTIENIRGARDDDPTSFIANRSSFVEELERRYGEVYAHLILPMSGYLGVDRGGLGEIRKSAEEALEKVQRTGEDITVVEDTVREAAGETAASVTAEHYEDLAEKFKSYKLWISLFFLYLVAWIIFFLVLWQDMSFRAALQSFDVSNAPAYVLKIVLLAVFLFGLNFISKNYNARLQVHITAHTRATRIKTWRAFIGAEELKDNEDSKARIAEGIARVMFSDIPTGLDKSGHRLFDDLFGRRDKQE